ncbi:MAG: homoserine kinase [Pseudomonadota bacterium]|uniref:homoserine kinase n=1 Tax=Gallaecimonas pentaromativorans TaxID=584787 RepID=UPI00067F2DE5|nr:homoserine kinase [Gallaecimonas pentaromativorans]MED5525456.1 homoserine kinase [Pseudomonadota bacterium]
MVRVFAPATSANLNVGFDSLGVALAPLDGPAIGDVLTVEEAVKDRLEVTGPYAHELSGTNIVEKALWRFRELTGNTTPVAMHLEKGMPIGSGIGSSAASVVAAVVAINRYFGSPLDSDAAKALMAELEGELSGGVHWDNLLPCLLGGLCLHDAKLPVPENWVWLLAYPGIRLETKAMRAILPKEIALGQAVAQASNLGRFVDALYRGEGRMAAKLMVDNVVEPCRAPLVPGFLALKDKLMAQGALSSGLSGSGPTLFAIFDNLAAAKQALADAQRWVAPHNGFAHLCRVDDLGARTLES